MTIRQTLRIRQGETWQFAFVALDGAGEPIDLTGYSARLVVRTEFGGSTEVILSTSEGSNGDIALADDGTVTLSMSAAQTTNLLESVSLEQLLSHFSSEAFQAMRFVCFIYDLELTSPSADVTRVLQGNMNVERGVSY